jgi:hypothetical protein
MEEEEEEEAWTLSLTFWIAVNCSRHLSFEVIRIMHWWHLNTFYFSCVWNLSLPLCTLIPSVQVAIGTSFPCFPSLFELLLLSQCYHHARVVA